MLTPVPQDVSMDTWKHNQLDLLEGIHPVYVGLIWCVHPLVSMNHAPERGLFIPALGCKTWYDIPQRTS